MYKPKQIKETFTVIKDFLKDLQSMELDQEQTIQFTDKTYHIKRIL